MHDNIRRYLEAELDSQEFTHFYEYLKITYQILDSYPLYSDLLLFLHNKKNLDYRTKDNLLKTFICEYQRNHDARLSTFLIVIFYPGIGKMIFKNSGYFKGEIEELSSSLRSLLLEVIAAFDCIAKPSKIASTVVGRVRNRLRKILRQRFETADVNLENIPDKNAGKTDRIDAGKFMELANQGGLTEEEANIIIQTRLNRVKLKELAALSNISYGALRKKRQRAEEKIRKFNGTKK